MLKSVRGSADATALIAGNTRAMFERQTAAVCGDNVVHWMLMHMEPPFARAH